MALTDDQINAVRKMLEVGYFNNLFQDQTGKMIRGPLTAEVLKSVHDMADEEIAAHIIIYTGNVQKIKDQQIAKLQQQLDALKASDPTDNPAVPA